MDNSLVRQRTRDKLPGNIIFIILLLTLAPQVLHMWGVNLANPAGKIDLLHVTHLPFAEIQDYLYRIFSGPFTHSLLEWSAFAAAIFTAILAFAHYHISKDVAVPIIGMALFFSGCMDAFHTLAADRLITGEAKITDLVPFTWATARLFNACILYFGVTFILIVGHNRFKLSPWLVIFISLVSGLMAYLIIYYIATSPNLPQTQFPGAVLTRPYDIVPAAIFLFGFVYLYPRFYRLVKSPFADALIWMAFVEVVLELNMSFGSSQLFDAHFNIAHYLKIIAYIIPLVGLIIDYLQTYKNERIARNKLIMQTEALKEANKTAVNALKIKSEFLACMSHEIRTPMNGVLGMLELLSDTSLDKGQLEYAQTAYSSARTLLNIINDILDFSKLESGKLQLESIDFNIWQELNSILNLLYIQARDKNVTMALLFDDKVPKNVCGDPTRLRQIIINLANNAIKFTEAGGHIIIRVALVEQLADKLKFRFIIEDTGIGIAEDALAKIFESFVQADSSTSRRFGGTGLGLAITRQLVTSMQGDISVESVLNKGTTFTFHIILKPGASDDGQEFMQHPFVDAQALVIAETEAMAVLELQLTSWQIAYQHHSLSEFLSASASVNCNDYVVAIIQLEDGKSISEEIIVNIKKILEKVPIVVLYRDALSEREKQLFSAENIEHALSYPVRQSALYGAICDVLNVEDPIQYHRHTDYIGTTIQKSVKKGYILVVDDSQVNLKVAVSMLKKLRCQVDTASNGEEAIAKAAENNYDLIFMDCQMPIIDGYEATRRIRDQGVQDKQYMPIVALTAHALSGDKNKCFAAGMDDYVTKPFKMDDLKIILKKYLSIVD